jgi:hypothetical protein
VKIPSVLIVCSLFIIFYITNSFFLFLSLSLTAILIIVCMMQLLTLLTIYAGFQPDDEEGDDTTTEEEVPDQATNDSLQLREWRSSDYIQVVISVTGFYTGFLGLKATQEHHTIVSARKYFLMLLLVGISWCVFAFFDALRAQNLNPDEETTETDQMVNAIFATLLTVLVWLTCFVRAFQYQRDLNAEEARQAAVTTEVMAALSEAISEQEIRVDAQQGQAQPAPTLGTRTPRGSGSGVVAQPERSVADDGTNVNNASAVATIRNDDGMREARM